MIKLSGSIINESGVYISKCNELNISTCSSDIMSAMTDTLEMIVGYFDASAKVGLIEKDLKRLAAGEQINQSFDLETDFVLPPEFGFHFTSKRTIDLSRAV